MPGDPAIVWEELDPDSTEGFGSIGAGTAAKELLKRHAALHPPELMALKAAPRIQLASEALDLEEVQRAAKPNGEVKGGSVRGDSERNPDSWHVTFIYVTESDRSAPGAISYSKLPDSRAEYEVRQAALLRGGTTAADASGDDRDATAREQAQSDEIARLRTELEEAQDPQPYEGYADAGADAVKEHVQGLDLTDPENYVAVQGLLDYEQRHKDRSTVVKVAEKAIADEDERRKAAEAGGDSTPGE